MPAPIVVIAAAMAVPSTFYRPVVGSFERHGWEVQIIPTRGFERGEPVASRSHDWSYADVIADIADAVSAARADDPARPVILLGHSLGSQVGAGHQMHHSPADGFVTVGASVPHFRYYRLGGAHLLGLGVAVPVVTRLLGYLPKPMFGAPGAKTLMSEWARLVRTGKPPFALPHKITSPSLAVQIQGDTYAVPASNERFVELFIDPDAATRWEYTTAAAPEGGQVHHLLWVKQPEVVVATIVDWWTSTAVAS